MKKNRPSLMALLSRCVRLRCPVCGGASIVARPFHIKHYCPSCDALFKREDGFFVGAIAVSVVTTEAVILVIYVLCLLLLGERDQLMLSILLSVAVVFPLAFYHHGWSVWLSFDHLIEGLPKHVGRDDDE